MKRYIILSLLLALLLPLPACAHVADKSVGISPEDIERRNAEGYKTSFFAFANDGVLLNITHPKEWSFQKTEAGADIIRDGKTVGTLSLGIPEDGFETLSTEKLTQRGVTATKRLEKKGTAEYRFRYVYKYESGKRSRNIYLTAALGEVDEKSEDRLFKGVLTVDKVKSDTMGVLAEKLGDDSYVAILGNSFVSTSDIGAILTEMFDINGKRCRVTAISRGYASVGTYADDGEMLQSIRKGRYDAVFICGFYSDQTENLGVLKRACDQSKTELVIFPAHNENAGFVSDAHVKYPSLVLLDWKSEIDKLISSGVSKWDMCIQDSHRHSTPLAGYVGAHMIYRAIYGQTPLMPMSRTMSQLDIDGILGDYAYVGDAKIISESKIFYLN